MSLDLKGIKTKFKLIAQQQVGTRLSQLGAGGDIPAVVDARPTLVNGRAIPKPEYPYITLDVYGPLDNDNFYDTDRYIDPITELEVHVVRKRMMVRYTCYGGVSSSENIDIAQGIADDLKDKFRLTSVLDDIEDTLNASVKNISDLDNLPTLLSTGYIETASFNVIIELEDEVSDPNTFVIEETDLTGEVVLQDDSTLSVNVNVKPN